MIISLLMSNIFFILFLTVYSSGLALAATSFITIIINLLSICQYYRLSFFQAYNHLLNKLQMSKNGITLNKFIFFRLISRYFYQQNFLQVFKILIFNSLTKLIINFNGMHSYQFKTISSSLASQQLRPVSSQSSFNFLNQSDLNLKEMRSSQTGSSFSGNNINDMKSRLDELLKQTDMITDKKVGSPRKNSYDVEKIEGFKRFGGNVSMNLDKGSRQDTSLLGQSINSLGNKYRKQQFKPTLNETSNLFMEGNRQNTSKKNSSKTIENILSNEKKLSEGFKDFPSFNLKLNNISKHNDKDYSKQSSQLSSNLPAIVPQIKSTDTEIVQKKLINNEKNEKQIQIKTYEQIKKQEKVQGNDSYFNVELKSKQKKEEVKRIEIPNNLLECQITLRVLDQDYRKLKQEFSDMTQGKEYYRKQLSQSWRSNKQLKDEYEQKIAEIKRTHTEQIQKLEQKIKKKDINITQLVNELAEAKTVPLLPCFEQKANKIIEHNKQLMEIQILKQKQACELRSEMVEKDITIDQLSQKISWYEDEIKELNNFKTEYTLSQAQSFDEILKMQLKSIAQFKQVVERLNEKNNELRQKLKESGRKNEELANEIRILELKHKNSFNNSIMEQAVQLSNKENSLSSLNKKATIFQEKYKFALNEIKSKDEFFKQHLLGRTNSNDVKEYIESILQKYREKFIKNNEQELKKELERAHEKIALFEKYASD